jgi:hypothetical protein
MKTRTLITFLSDTLQIIRVILVGTRTVLTQIGAGMGPTIGTEVTEQVKDIQIQDMEEVTDMQVGEVTIQHKVFPV